MKEKNSEKERPSITIREFMEQFSTDEVCLQHLFDCRFGQGHPCPKCAKKSNWYRFKAERAFACQWCGHHLHPTVGTPFEDSRTPLQLWFYAIYLFTTSRHGVPAKELERQLGVTYKTAWRMARLIREHMADLDGEFPLSGDVEIDETYMGGRRKWALGRAHKTTVLGMLQRNFDVVGINRPSLYAAFGNKKSLFRKALAYYAKGPSSYLSEALQEPTARAVVERLLRGVVSYYVIPEYLAIGSSNDYFLEPMTPMLAQRISVLLGCTLPTRKMVNDIWAQTQVQMAPMPITYNQTNPPITVPWFNTYNSNIWAQRQTYLPTFPLGNSVAGDKKDVIISTYIYNNLQNGVTTPVVIYGWQYQSGIPIQPLYNGHSDLYMDYSHGIRLVQQAITVDGAPTTVSAVLTNPALAALLSDETVFTGNTIPQPYYTVAATAPAIITQPYSRSVKQGANVTFSVLSAGDGPLNYFWQRNSQIIASGTNATLSITNAQGGNAGTYSVIVSNSAGTATSQPTFLLVSSNSYPVLFADNFDTDSSANWNFFWGADDNLPDYTTNWAFNYGAIPYTYNGVTYLIPPAPNSTNGTTSGVRFTVNNSNNANAGVNIYPKGQSFSGNFALKFDMWINYPGGAEGAGGQGTTQFAIYGVNFLGTEANWAAASATSTDGIWFANDGDGGSFRDYRAYLGNLSGTESELIGTFASGLSQSNHTTSIYTTLFPSPPSETVGTPGKTWAAVEIDQTNGTLIWKMNGTVIAQRANTSSFASGDIMLGLMDVFPSIANPAIECYVIYDNIRVENLSAAPIIAPTVTTQPQGSSLNPGQTASFSVAAGGSTPMSYQWFVNGALLAGQTGSTLVLTNIQPSNTGQYYAQVSNGAGSALSSPALLTVSTNWTLSAPQIINKQFQFTLIGASNVDYIIDYSSNLATWIPWQTSFPALFIDTTSSNFPVRFYRARPGP